MGPHNDPSLSNLFDDDFIPRSLLLLREGEIKHYIKAFIQYLLVKTNIVGQGLLDFDVKLLLDDRDECHHLSDDLKEWVNTCSSVCGFYDHEYRRILIYLGCLSRSPATRVADVGSILEYTLFHLIAHLFQSYGGILTKLKHDLTIENEKLDIFNYVKYTIEVEADYLARIFQLLSEEEEIDPLGRDAYLLNKYIFYIWPPLKTALRRLHSVCKELDKIDTYFNPYLLDDSAVCYNPFRWVASRVARVFVDLYGVIDVIKPGNSFTVLLANPLSIRVKEPIAGIYIDEYELCFAVAGNRLYLCYASGRRAFIRAPGFYIELEEAVEIDLVSVKELMVLFKPPSAVIKIKQGDKVIELNSRLKYAGELPGPIEYCSSISDLNSLIRSIELSTDIPAGTCDSTRSRKLYLIDLREEGSIRGVSNRARDTLYLSKIAIPVDENICTERRNIEIGGNS